MDWALLPLSTKGCLVRWFRESEVRFHGEANHGVPFHCLRRGHYATQLDPWCGTLLCPDCTRSEELVQNFHRRVTCHRHTSRSRQPPPVWSGPCERSYQGIMVDAVHPQSGKYQTACATVPGHMEYSEVVVTRRYNKGERLSSYLAMVTASFTMAKSMNAVVTMGAINAAYLS